MISLLSQAILDLPEKWKQRSGFEHRLWHLSGKRKRGNAMILWTRGKKNLASNGMCMVQDIIIERTAKEKRINDYNRISNLDD